MCQDSILKFLKKNVGWWTNNELSKELKINNSSINTSTAKLAKQGYIQQREVHMRITRTQTHSVYIYRIKKDGNKR